MAKKTKEIEEEDADDAVVKKSKKKKEVAEDDGDVAADTVVKKSKKRKEVEVEEEEEEEDDIPVVKKSKKKKEVEEEPRETEEPEEPEEKEKPKKKYSRSEDQAIGRKLYVGGYSTAACDEEALRKKFGKYGEIEEVLVYSKKGSQKGIAFVTYTTKEEAEAALELNGFEWKGFPLKVQLSGKVSNITAVFVGGLPMDFDEDALRQRFAKCGKITKFEVPLSKGKKAAKRGIAFVTFETRKAVESALKLDGKAYEGNTLKVKEFEPTAAGEKMKAKKKSKKEAQDQKVFRVWVGGLPKTADGTKVKDFFLECGEIKKFMMPTHPKTGKGRGMALINYKTEQGMKEALRLNEQEFQEEHVIKVKVAGAPNEKKNNKKNKKRKQMASAEASAEKEVDDEQPEEDDGS
eukprot:TRINITY_DN12802_c0_g2_i3.p1 TRINITY_DN12802_c0_g2~~TRINITY_DN12802_c0_g2_i3.p1  ORF type:complete len:405 (-),score=155.89 TRINITY_DN12802_c0_g2_i3:214-1428(-)